jgi:hypothetical protein
MIKKYLTELDQHIVKIIEDSKAPWEKKNPAKKHHSMTSAQKSQAKARAKKAGRPYPNLVDNMAVMKKD